MGFVGGAHSGGKRVLIVVNGQQCNVKLKILWQGWEAEVNLPPDSVNTFEWSGSDTHYALN